MKNYVKPMMESEVFAANEYIAACGDTEYGNYLFECDAPAGNLYYYRTNWWGDEVAERLGSYDPCNRSTKHQQTVNFLMVLWITIEMAVKMTEKPLSYGLKEVLGVSLQMPMPRQTWTEIPGKY